MRRVAWTSLHGEAQLKLPYLPDPWSVATALVGLPGLAAGTVTRVQPDGTLTTEPDQLPGRPPQPGVLLVDWGTPQSWWQARPFRLLVVEGSGPPAWDAATRVLTVALPKAARVDVQVSSLPDEQHLDEHGAWRALLDVAAAQDVPALRQLARTGRLWAVSPARTVRLVHALQHPLHAPDVLVLGATRLPSSTSAILAERSASTPPAPTGWTSRRAGRNGPTSGALAATTRRPGGAHGGRADPAGAPAPGRGERAAGPGPGARRPASPRPTTCSCWAPARARATSRSSSPRTSCTTPSTGGSPTGPWRRRGSGSTSGPTG